GRSGEKAATGLTEQLQQIGFISGRMKTGTPPRIDGRTINYQKLEIQEGDPEIRRFSFTETEIPTRQLPCYIAYTNPTVHKILEEGFDKSPMFCGRIQGTGPRYCPSIEDKIVRFSERERHQLFIEPEGWKTIEVYLNGFSSSLPEEIQYKALQKIEGFENAKMFRPGYAIEYDYFPPHQLYLTLETRLVENLYFAGQINGTTGYEEAAAQGLIAGINAALKIQQKEPLILRRDQAYIGVLIDDLVHKSTDEPYRMFTSRAEFRILLRQDNADLRLTEIGYRIGLASEQRYQNLCQKKTQIQIGLDCISKLSIDPAEINSYLESIGDSPLQQKIKADQVLRRPSITLQELLKRLPNLQTTFSSFTPEVIEQIEIQIKYAGYIQKEIEMASKIQKFEHLLIPADFDFKKIHGLSNEAKDKLTRFRPQSLGQASRISGISPSDISVLLIYMGR
ncbi:MAG: tRNA uridine-5-carboxymethylaminomethyl(34) synthesis enzyme MnmG, partial [Bacteroidia bacterium]|nr:tRNA uridine-5-carboxymethylaminomethyl(34) synthesis enzyme MnmG [Bacteroidia bacterium]